MAPRYQIFFVPHLKDRTKISDLRNNLCKKCNSTKALQYPVHMSFIGGTKIKNYRDFEDDLKKFCSKEKKQILKTGKYTEIVKKRGWSGIHIEPTKELLRFRKKLRALVGKHTLERRAMRFIPHITLVFPADVSKLKKIKNPVQNLLMDRITIAKKEESGVPYRIYKHIKID
ncbi:2'-5' RNA ligase family protein [Candidatus Woesearchaeota archaeon]|nr:2'-5' RNA ligase family protein [Candidatus Woesearchaeota archaeon]